MKVLTGRNVTHATLREHLRIHKASIPLKVFDEVLLVIFHKFSINAFVMGIHLNGFDEANSNR